MNKALLAAGALVVFAGALAALSPLSLRAAEPDDEPHIVDAVMRVDLAPVVAQIQALHAEVASLKASIEAMQKAAEASKEHQDELLSALRRLAPVQWDYKILHIINEDAAKREGLAGWEMVTITPQGWIFMKRPLLGVERLPELR